MPRKNWLIMVLVLSCLVRDRVREIPLVQNYKKTSLKE
jgi:hypothetical protein